MRSLRTANKRRLRAKRRKPWSSLRTYYEALKSYRLSDSLGGVKIPTISPGETLIFTKAPQPERDFQSKLLREIAKNLGLPSHLIRVQRRPTEYR